ncbi:Alpha/Beta hydrolase protein [Chytridium lagenaria]|nr:Alpha/Beta hydrolase protein [Chytridium lagenaria]
MTMADDFVDSSKVGKRPTWSPAYFLTVSVMTKLFHKFKDNIEPGRKIIDNARFPKPVHVKVQKTYIPRRSDVLPLGMREEDAKGNIKAEWIDGSVSADITKPAGRVILYAHGGAYFMGSRKTHRSVTWRLAKYAKARVLSIEYRLAPEYHFPTPINDMVSAYLHLIDPPEGSPKYRPDQIVFMGDSAGGNLCMVSALYLRDSEKWPVPAGLGLICPWMDLTHSSPSFVLNGAHDFLPAASSDPKFIKDGQVHYYVPPGVDMRHPLVSPLFAEEIADKPLPPTLIQVGTAERLRDENVSFYAEKFKESKIQLELYEDMIHVWHLFAPAETVARNAIRRLADFVLKIVPDTADTPVAFDRRVVHVLNSKGFPEEEFDDPLNHLEKERAKVMAFGTSKVAVKENTSSETVVLNEEVLMVDVEEAVVNEPEVTEVQAVEDALEEKAAEIAEAAIAAPASVDKEVMEDKVEVETPNIAVAVVGNKSDVSEHVINEKDESKEVVEEKTTEEVIPAVPAVTASA